VQWVAFRAAEGAWLKAPLPSAPEIGPGWRGVELRRFHPIDQLDPLVIDTAARAGVAIGVAEAGDAFGYIVAAAERSEPVRLVVGVDPSDPGAAAEALARARTASDGTSDRAGAVGAFVAWSVNAPATIEASTLAPLLEPDVPVERALSEILRSLQIALPIEPIPDPLDLQDMARGQLVEKGGRRRVKEASARRRTWFTRSG
jgi:hypothetical protein